MIAFNKSSVVPVHVLRSRDFIRESIASVLHDCRVDGNGSREDLLETAGVIVAYLESHADEPWPRSCTRLLNLAGELAAAVISEPRQPCPYLLLRNLLQAMWNHVNDPIADEPALQFDDAQKESDLAMIRAAASEISLRSASKFLVQR